MMKKRFVFLFLVLCLSMATSAQAVVYISTADELYNIRNDPTGDYKLTADIDMSTLTANGGTWLAIGHSGEGNFTGTFDGDYHIIKNLTAVEVPGAIYKNCSVFGIVAEGAVIKNVGVTDFDITAGWYAAALVGDLRGAAINCFVSDGTVTGLTGSYGNIGTLNGHSRTNSTFTNCYSDAHVTFPPGSTFDCLGGFSGNISSLSTTNCYFAGTITRVPENTGLGGPFQGNGAGPLVSCYYDSDTTGYPDGTKAYNPPGLPTTEMMKQGTYVDWDFGSTWTMIPGQTYPRLAGFGLLAAGNPVPYGGIIPTSTSQLCWSPPEIDADGDPITGDITYNVYFGTDPNFVLEYPYGLTPLGTETSETCVSVAPGTFETNNVYYWAVTSHTDGGDIPGLLWPLATAKTNASSPSPADGEPGAPRNAQLSWTSGEDEFGELPDSHKLYMDPNATYVTERNCGAVAVCVTLPAGTTTYDPDLEWGETYYWVVDEDYGAGGIEEGDVWSFTVDPELECGLLPGDLTADCLVNLDDFAVLAYDWLNCLIINDSCPDGYN